MRHTDNDTWDLATSVGATATMVAAARAVATRAQNRIIVDPFAEPLVRAVGIDFFTRWASGELDSADVDIPGAPWGLQRMSDANAARTRYFDTLLLDAVAAGIRQVVILASGLDARAYRLQWPTDVRLFEIDQPQVVEFKMATIAQLGAEPTAELNVVPIDLRHDWPAALLNTGFDPNKPAVWIAEGLLGFLPPRAQDLLLGNITALSAAGSRLGVEVFLNVHDNAAGQSEAILSSTSQRWREFGFDIEFAQLGFEGERNDVATYLDERGWRSTRTTLGALLADNRLPPIPLTDGPTFGNNYYCTSTR
ncbi:SAM-dependent methyltransferase [Mycobacterium sp.]|uniref:SAM-dependent methyltransferase n=1 Tax=Mycobacterium sp. TaxID=1785 RepID=UPI003BA8A1F7